MNRREHVPKSMMDIKKDLKEKKDKKIKDTKIPPGQLKKKNVKDLMSEILEEERQTLLDYYYTPEGRMEIDESPHRHLSTKEAVELLMQDVAIMARKELEEYE